MSVTRLKIYSILYSKMALRMLLKKYNSISRLPFLTSRSFKKRKPLNYNVLLDFFKDLIYRGIEEFYLRYLPY